MSIEQIEVHEHRVKMDNFSYYRQVITDILQKTLQSAELQKIDVYNMNGTVERSILGGHKERMIIMGHYPLEQDGALEIRDAEGVLLATYIEKESIINQLNIFPDLFGTYNDDNIRTFQFILNQMEEKVFLQKILDYSWKSTSKKEQLTQSFTSALRSQQEKYIREDKRKIENAEQSIRDYTLELKRQYENRNRLMNQVESAEVKLKAVDGQIIKELDNIVANPKVKELFIKDGKFIVHTQPIYAYHDRTGERYYIGNMKIEMNPQNTQVKFFGDNPRKSYWGEGCPHPHVNTSGEACLGNVSTTIAELCAQMELYALTLICIDFLESVNTSDAAGKNIVNWDKVDDDGNIIAKGGEEKDLGDDPWTCDHCGELQHEDADTYRVYTSYSANINTDGDHYNTEYSDEIYVCESCLHQHYTYRDDIDEYVRNGNYDVEYDEEDEEEEE
jgi:hypothetical protein